MFRVEDRNSFVDRPCSILREEPDRAQILALRQLTPDDPAKYRGTTWHVGGLSLLGELLEDDGG